MNAPCTDSAAKRLEGELTIQFASEHRVTLLAMLEETPEDLCLDLSAIEACDSSGIQLLLATRRSLHDRQRELRIPAVSASVKQVLDIYGLQPLLQEATAT